MTESRTVVIVAYDNHQLLDFAGPVEVFETANALLGRSAYRRIVATPDGNRVRTSSGIEIGADTSLASVAAEFESVDTLMVVGGLGTDHATKDRRIVAPLVQIASCSRRVTSVCTGSLVLAAAGLLDGHRATSHWSMCDHLARRYPGISVEPDQIYVRDRNRWTSAGVTAGIDLALALVEDDYGSELAHTIARWLVVFTRRPGGQSQFSTQLRMQAARTPAIRTIQQWIPDHLEDDLSVAALAKRAEMSERNFARVFRAEIGETPASYVESTRIEAARRLLETTELTIGAVARAVGFRHAETLHRAISRRLATTPDRYRQHFAVKAS